MMGSANGIRKILLAVAFGLLAPSTAFAGACEADYTWQYPEQPGHFWATAWYTVDRTIPALGGQSHEVGRYEVGVDPVPPLGQYRSRSHAVGRKAYPTAYRNGFTTSQKDAVWDVAAGQTAYPYYQGKVDWNWTGPTINPGPTYTVTVQGRTVPAALVRAGVVSLTNSYVNIMRKDTDPMTAHPTVHPDPHQHARRFVLTHPRPQTLHHYDW